MQKQEKSPQGLLPSEGLISIEELAGRLGTDKYRLARKLMVSGIPTVNLTRLLSQRFVRLENLKGEILP